LHFSEVGRYTAVLKKVIKFSKTLEDMNLFLFLQSIPWYLFSWSSSRC